VFSQEVRKRNQAKNHLLLVSMVDQHLQHKKLQNVVLLLRELKI
jgi:hypothetical protein